VYSSFLFGVNFGNSHFLGNYSFYLISKFFSIDTQSTLRLSHLYYASNYDFLFCLVFCFFFFSFSKRNDFISLNFLTLMLLSTSYFFGGVEGTAIWTEYFPLAKQVLYTSWTTSLVNFALVILETGSLELFALAGLEPQSSQS
jgi:hypothetical protein